MTNQNFIGIDISKTFLDVYIHPAGVHSRYPNTPAGHRDLMRAIGDPHTVQMVCFEASGGYERALRTSLAQAEYCHACVQPGRVHHFIKAHGECAKTDALDARTLALFAVAHMAKPSHTPDQNLQILRDMTRTLAFIRRQKSILKNQIEKTPQELLIHRLQKLHDTIADEEKELLNEIKHHVQNHKSLTDLAATLQTMPGIGFYTAVILIAELPELGTCSKAEIAALTGTAPYTRQSGSWTGKASIKGGRHHARKALYMATLTASRFNPAMKLDYQSLKAKGKPSKVILTALMRKIIVTLNAMVKNNANWTQLKLDS